MKKIYNIILLAAGLLLCHCLGFAQITDRLECIVPSYAKLKQISDTLDVQMGLIVVDRELGRMQEIVVTPKLMGDNGESYEFEPFVVGGKMRQGYLIRQARLDKAAVPVFKQEYVYSERIAFAQWMDHSHLILDGRTTTCADGNTGRLTRLVTDSIELEPKLPPHPYVMKPMVNFITPETEPIKNRSELGTARIEFMSGRSLILPNYNGNQLELDRINGAIRAVLQDTLATVHSINITSYASPEGSYAQNKRLSQLRADALRMYVESGNDLGGIKVTTKSVAEDWDGLQKLIDASDISCKELILATILNTPNPDARDAKIKAIEKGVHWQRMSSEWFPQLRRTDYQLNYSVKDFSLDVARQIIKTRPGQLSLNEMFHVANSYEQGSAEFNEVFDIAVRMFPDSPVANINAAASAIRQGDSVAALKYLKRVEGDARAYNNWCAYYMLVDDLEQAKEWLTKNPEHTQATTHNQTEINIKEQDNELFKKQAK